MSGYVIVGYQMELCTTIPFIIQALSHIKDLDEVLSYHIQAG